MSKLPAPVARCPDLLLLAPSPSVLTVTAVISRFGRESILWRERLALSGAADSARLLAEHLRALLGVHAVRLKTPVVLIVPPVVGGFVQLPAAGGLGGDQAWFERQLTLQLPFASDEIVWRRRACPTGSEVFWLPRAWLNALDEALGRLGLVLSAALPRAALMRDQSTDIACYVVREAGGLAHVFQRGAIVRSLVLPADEAAAEQRLALELAALDIDAARVRQGSGPTTVETESAAALAAWGRGDEALELIPGRWGIWAPIWRWGLIIAALTIAALSVIQFQRQALEERNDELARDHRKALETRKKVMLLEKALRAEQRLLDEIAAIQASPTPVEMLAKLTEALPEGVWLNSLSLKNGRLEWRGRGADSARVVELLAEKGIAAQAVEAAEQAPMAAGQTSFAVFTGLTLASAAAEATALNKDH